MIAFSQFLNYSSYLMKDKQIKSKSSDGAIRVTFSFQDDDVTRVDELRHRLGHHGTLVNQSEVVRLGLLALIGLPDNRVTKLADDLRRVKAGRRPKEETDD
jgi:hypothetical protein